MHVVLGVFIAAVGKFINPGNEAIQGKAEEDSEDDFEDGRVHRWSVFNGKEFINERRGGLNGGQGVESFSEVM